jgi:formylglycine-generating enzyme required for sulfatase activity
MNKAVYTGFLAVAMLIAALPSHAYYSAIRDLRQEPIPPNPVTVSGRVTSESPLRISDGSAEVELSGITATLSDYLVVTGDWDGSVLTVTGQAKNYVGPAHVEMVYVPAGSFQMGNSGVGDDALYGAESPQHQVYLSGYWIGKHEITRGQYRKFRDSGGYTHQAYWSDDGWYWITNRDWTHYPLFWQAQQNWGDPPGTFTQGEDYPISGVCYYEAEAFCKWAGGRLPTEAQWEKAARWDGIHPRIYPWGDTWDWEKCNSEADSLYPGWQTAPVGSYPTDVSPYGCYDMAGNVLEFCSDWMVWNYYSQTPLGGWIDPQGPTSPDYPPQTVMRGGSWGRWYDQSRCASRMGVPRDGYYLDFGFRMAH